MNVGMKGETEVETELARGAAKAGEAATVATPSLRWKETREAVPTRGLSCTDFPVHAAEHVSSTQVEVVPVLEVARDTDASGPPGEGEVEGEEEEGPAK